jgi:hypothetical protein
MQQPEESLLHQLRALELQLQQPEVRSDASRLDALIHEEFQEFGRSGTVYSKADIVALLSSAKQHEPVIADNFVVRRLAADVALLIYRSAHALPDGTLRGHALRSSIWQRSAVGWQMSFHQGTATEPGRHA